ncbi:potassium-transporting ATPase subunit KdpB [Planctomonas sp. JC2975]|uniref:potassium-transporting ATPase subunit KdpB n=1 Tax=Planctomonas sp. JC2975 TaxID=2729626 RepID=UPI001472BE37|nr:potassium-transporting ATPase subunit KdpB [Planctomonas sp. JC2975]NNC13593.1 potassium-transporting ATPase subunit KdpB [Planctomonas sp. JC2975]
MTQTASGTATGGPTAGGERFVDPFRIAVEALRRLDPRMLWSNPVLFITWCGAVLTTFVAIAEPFVGGPAPSGGTVLPGGFTWAIAIWVWLTLYTANIAEAIAEGRGRSRTVALRSVQGPVTAHRIVDYEPKRDPDAHDAAIVDVRSDELRPGDFVVLGDGDPVPLDGAIVWGVASIDESAITGDSGAVIRAAGGDRTGVSGGTTVVSDRIVVKVTARYGESAVDLMIDLAEGRRRQKSPNELALSALIASLSLSFVIVALTLNTIVSPVAPPVSIPILVAIVVCLIPTEIAALLSVTGIAAMSRLLQQNVLVSSAHDLETAGDLTIVMLDKTGTITRGNRRAVRFVPLDGVPFGDLVHGAWLASVADPTTEGTSTVELAVSTGVPSVTAAEPDGRPVGFSARTRMSGRDLPDGTRVRKGSETSVLAWLKHIGTQQRREVVDELTRRTMAIARTGGTPLVVAIEPPDEPPRVLGVIDLRDSVKPVVPAKLARLRALGVRTLMVTGDNPQTAEVIAAEAGVDDFLGDANPERKLDRISREQAAGNFVAMTGDGTNDAPALAQADVGVSMNTATAAAKAAANMIVLDDDPTRLVEIIEAGRRQMATRGALITFNIANDFVRYFAMFPALFVGTFPGLASLNVLGLHSPASAILSTLIFSVVVMGVLIPLALAGVPYRMTDLARALTRNLLYYGVGGVLIAAVGIKLIDLVVGLIPGY